MKSTHITSEVVNSVLTSVETAPPQETSIAHGRRVADYCYLVAELLGLDEKKSRKLKETAVYHDVGKLLIPRNILDKPGSLSADEYKQIQAHTTNGYSILKKAKTPILREAARLALQHHENIDGSGYPFGLAENDLSIEAKIIRVADTYDALTSVRSYRRAKSSQEAMAILKENAGTQFDVEVIKAFNAVLKERLELDFTQEMRIEEEFIHALSNQD